MATSPFHPDLAIGRFIPSVPPGRLMIALTRRFPGREPASAEGVTVTTVQVPGEAGNPGVKAYVAAPAGARDQPRPALVWTHGGGYVIGTAAADHQNLLDTVRAGIVVVNVDYRLAPEHPHPAALDDATAALRWVHAHGADHGIDTTRVAVGGASAGGGLAAALANRAHDLGGLPVAFQLLSYPMLDDRTVLRTDVDTRGMRVWRPGANRSSWGRYLGVPAGSAGVPLEAVPARRGDLTGLPPAWIGVGTLDLFHDEDLAYARRLEEARVPVQVLEVPGAFHGFDLIMGKAGVSQEYRASMLAALCAGLGVTVAV